jgi:hypothetical protein
VKLGLDPYGFLAKFQALSITNWTLAPADIVKLLIDNDRMLDAYINALRACAHFDTGNGLSQILPKIQSIRQSQIDGIIEAYNGNSELQGSFGFSGSKPSVWGRGLLPHLKRWTGREYVSSGVWPHLRVEPSAT